MVYFVKKKKEKKKEKKRKKKSPIHNWTGCIKSSMKLSFDEKNAMYHYWPNGHCASLIRLLASSFVFQPVSR